MPSTVRSSSKLASQFHALSDETRVRIMDLLRSGEKCVCELTDALELSQPLLSFHLKVLKTAGLVRDRRQSRWAYYAVNPDAIDELGNFVTILGSAPRRGKSPRCCD